MRHQIIRAIAPILLAGMQSSTASASNCDVSLFKHFETESISREYTLFFLDLVNEDNYKEAQNNIGASVPGYFSGNYDEFKKQRDIYRRQTEFKTHEKYSRQYAVNTLKANGLKAYTECLRSQRKESELLIYRSEAGSVDKRITFVVDLDTRVALQGPVRVDVFGAGKVLGSIGDNTKVTEKANALLIEIRNLIGGKQFTVERKDPRAPFQVTAQIAGKVAAPMEIGPTLYPVTKEVVSEISVNNTTNYLARRLEPGTDRYDFVWAVDNVSPNNNSVGRGEVFVGKACLCPGGERISWNAGWQTGGLCASAKSPDVRLLPETVVFAPSDKLQRYSCGGQPQEAVAKSLQFGPEGACFDVRLSLNAPPNGSVRCDVEWRITGKAVKRTVVLEPR